MRGRLQEVAVDRLKLVRQRIDAGDREREEGIVLVGQPQPMGLDAQAEQAGHRRRTARARPRRSAGRVAPG